MKKLVLVTGAIITILVLSVTSHADLIDRGGGLIYDTDLDITWLQNANYSGEQMNWSTAMEWAENLVYYDPARNVYWDDWRLPKARPVSGDEYDINYSYDGTTDAGWNITSPNSELAYLFYVELGNLGKYDTSGNPQSDYGLINTGPFTNMQSDVYYSSALFLPPGWGGLAILYFNFSNGLQDYDNPGIEFYNYAWAVRDGDVRPPPVPEFDYNVGVHYYPWYYNDFHGRQYLREHLMPPQLPELGEYNDRHESVINQHLVWCRNAGVDFWSASWWGPGSREDVTLLEHILQNPHLGSLKIAILYETVGRTNNFQDYSNLGPDITHLADNYFAHPNYLKIDGKPVIIVYLTRVLSSLGTLESSLLAMREAALDAGYELYIVGDHVFGSPPPSPGDIALLDAIINYDVYGSMGATGYAGQTKVDAYYAAQAGWKELAESVGTDYAPAVSPGFNDRGVRAGHDPLSRKLTHEDAFGSLFRAMLRGAKTLTDPDIGHMILVTSWNEWHEDTQIEPVKEAPPTSIDDSPTGNDYTNGLAYEGYGTRYLDILREETCGPAIVSLIPNSAIVPRGGTLGFQATVINNTDKAEIIYFATNVTLPNGNPYPPSGYLFGPVKISLSPYQSKSGHLSHTIPMSAPLGTYTYHGYVGKPGVGVIDEDQFDFEVTEAPAVRGPEDWETTLDQDFAE